MITRTNSCTLWMTLIQDIFKGVPADLLSAARPVELGPVLLDAAFGFVEGGVTADVLASGVQLVAVGGGGYTAETAGDG